jgi:hypothetical protein
MGIKEGRDPILVQVKAGHVRPLLPADRLELRALAEGYGAESITAHYERGGHLEYRKLYGVGANQLDEWEP